MLWNWIQVQSTGDYSYLAKSGSPDTEQAKKHWDNINAEMNSLRGEKKSVDRNIEKVLYLDEIRLKVTMGTALLNAVEEMVANKMASMSIFDQMLSELDSWGFALDREIPLHEALAAQRSEIEGYLSTIEALHHELYELPNEENGESPKETTAAQWYAMLLSYSRILKIDVIDPKKISCLQFTVYEKEVNKVMEETKKLQNAA